MCLYTHIKYACHHKYQTVLATKRECYSKPHEVVPGTNVQEVCSAAGKLCPQCEEKRKVIMDWMDDIDKAYEGVHEKGKY